MESGPTCYWGDPVGPVCAAGYKGAVCAVCADGYSFSGKSCNECVGFQFNALFIAFILALALLSFHILGKIAYMRTAKEKANSKSLSALMKKKKILARTRACVAQVMVIVGFAQVLATLGDTTGVEFPSAFDELSDSFSFLNFDLVNIISGLCFYKADYYETLIVQFCWPTVMLIYLVADHMRERMADPEDESAGVSQIKGIIMVLFTQFPLSVLIYLKFFLCREIEGEWFLQADYRYQCFDTQWNGYLAIALPGLLVYVLGVPAYFVGTLWWHKRNGTITHPVNEDKYEFLFLKFKKEYWYMEAYSLMVKFTLIGLIMYVLKGSATQVTVALSFGLLFLIVSLNTSPFKNNDMNSGETITRAATMVTLFCALLLKVKLYDIDEWSQGVLNGILLLVNLSVMIVFIFRFVRVQGLFLCQTYMPDVLSNVCLSCFIALGWREDKTVKKEDDEDPVVEEMQVLVPFSLKKEPSYQEQTFKCVS
jgi:hypothetical protein